MSDNKWIGSEFMTVCVFARIKTSHILRLKYFFIFIHKIFLCNALIFLRKKCFKITDKQKTVELVLILHYYNISN